MRTHHSTIDTAINCLAPAVAASSLFFKSDSDLSRLIRAGALLLNLSEIQEGARRVLSPAKTLDAMRVTRFSPIRLVAVLGTTYAGAIAVSKITKSGHPLAFAASTLISFLFYAATAGTLYYELQAATQATQDMQADQVDIAQRRDHFVQVRGRENGDDQEIEEDAAITQHAARNYRNGVHAYNVDHRGATQGLGSVEAAKAHLWQNVFKNHLNVSNTTNALAVGVLAYQAFVSSNPQTWARGAITLLSSIYREGCTIQPICI